MCLYVGGCLAGGTSPTDREARGPSASARQVRKPSDWDIILSLPKSKTALSIVRTINVFFCFVFSNMSQKSAVCSWRAKRRGSPPTSPTSPSSRSHSPSSSRTSNYRFDLSQHFIFSVDTYFVLLRQKIFLVSPNANRKICRKCACHGYVVGKRKVGNFSPNHRLILVLMSRFLGHVIMDTYI